MSDWETTDYVSTRSVLRHRPIGKTSGPLGKRKYVTAATPPVVQRASRPRRADVTDDILSWHQSDEEVHTQDLPYELQTDAGTRRLVPASRAVVPVTGSKPAPVTNPPRRTGSASRQLTTKTQRLAHEPVQRAHPLLLIGIVMLGMVAVWGIVSTGINWANTTLDDYRYGRPRTFQIDAAVGHNEQMGTKSHFIAINLDGRIEIIEMPGGDPTRARMYVGPQVYGANNQLIPVTLDFKDVNGDQKPDMVANFQGSRVVFINDGAGFRPPDAKERQQIEQFFATQAH